MKKGSVKLYAKFLNKIQILKNSPRSGWFLIRAPFESIAAHSYRTALVGLILAKMAKLNENQTLELVKLCLLHDVEEIYTTDLHKIAKKYVKIDSKKVIRDVIEHKDLYLEYERLLKNKKVFELFLDADKVECYMTARYYADLGYKTKKWLETIPTLIKTKQAKCLLREFQKMNTLGILDEMK
mgnify:CR=1 FL=1